MSKLILDHSVTDEVTGRLDDWMFVPDTNQLGTQFALRSTGKTSFALEAVKTGRIKTDDLPDFANSELKVMSNLLENTHERWATRYAERWDSEDPSRGQLPRGSKGRINSRNRHPKR